MGISDDFQVYIKPRADIKEYCSDHDNRAANALLAKLQSKMSKSYEKIIDILVEKLSSITKVQFLIDHSFVYCSFSRGGKMGVLGNRSK